MTPSMAALAGWPGAAEDAVATANSATLMSLGLEVPAVNEPTVYSRSSQIAYQPPSSVEHVSALVQVR